ncbi:MAG: serine/threonine protein kinase, partial [candidate division WOR-3 bacterium]
MATNRETINGYTIDDKLGEGNYTVIYRVKTDKKKPLVLKIAKKATSELNELISREFQILSQFQHPNIAAVHDYGVAKDERSYFTMDYIDGITIDQAFTGFGEEFITAVLQIINALGAFHSKGFVHGDLAPENILYIKDKKKVVLIDFAFAGMPSEDKRMVGTIGYIAPEIYKGMGVDQRSDLYSLGVIMFEVLAGEPVRDPYVPIKGVPEEINNIIARCISKEPA